MKQQDVLSEKKKIAYFTAEFYCGEILMDKYFTIRLCI